MQLHGIQGINDGDDFLLDKSIVDETIFIKTKDAIARAKRLAKENGLLVGISSGANVLAAEQWVEKTIQSTPSLLYFVTVASVILVVMRTNYKDEITL
jgi:cysteine synthase